MITKQIYWAIIAVCIANLLLVIFDIITHRELAGVLFFSCMIFCVLLVKFLTGVWYQIDSGRKLDDIHYTLKDMRKTANMIEIMVLTYTQRQQDKPEERKNDQ